MLNLLEINNFTIIKRQTITFHAGLQIITGETGSGKSLVFDAIQIILGARVGSDVIRTGEQFCTICAQFDINQNQAAQDFLQAHDYDMHECIIKHSIYRDKPSKCTLNGSLISKKHLKSLTCHLLHINSQHASYQLIAADYQQSLLDHYAGHAKYLEKLQHTYQTWRQVQQKITDCKITIGEQSDRLAIIDYHLSELEPFLLSNSDLTTLNQQYQQISHAQHLHQIAYQSDNQIRHGDRAILNQIHSVIHDIESLVKTYPDLQSTLDSLNDVSIKMAEAAKDIQQIANQVSFDEDEQNQLDEAINQFNTFARKHRVSPDKLHAVVEQLHKQKQTILHTQDTLNRLEEEAKAIRVDYLTTATTLHESRVASAEILAQKINAELPKLGMQDARVAINIERQSQSFNALGQDNIQFLFSANPGFPLATLNSVASGGELSRLSLIIELITFDTHPKTTILFDEVDTGVSGKIARDIGHVLRKLSQHTQVLCITHLPQIASLAHNHLVVEKHIVHEETEAHIKQLSSTEKIVEVARLLDGRAVHKTALEQAQSLCSDV